MGRCVGGFRETKGTPPSLAISGCFGLGSKGKERDKNPPLRGFSSILRQRQLWVYKPCSKLVVGSARDSAEPRWEARIRGPTGNVC